MHSTEPVEELLQCYDENGNPTEAIPRTIVKRQPYQYWYAVTKIWLVNDKGEILCTKRSDLVSANPGKWQSYLGGHVSAGDSFLQCAVQEIGEEVGVLAKEDDLTLLDQGRNDTNKNFYSYYAMHCNADIADLQFVDREVSDARWMSIDAYKAEHAAHPDEWCSGITPEREVLLRKWMTA